MRLSLLSALTLVMVACGPSLQPFDGGRDAAAADVAVDASDVAVSDVVTRYEMPRCERVAGPYAPLSTRCQHFVDRAGRVVLLHGINARIEGVFDVTFDDGREALEPVPRFENEDAARMRALGFNLLRLPINWSGLEPQRTGGLSDQYIARVRAVVDIARRAGLYVLLDFHQDAYSKEIGEDGAPKWAIHPAPAMALGGPLTEAELTRRRASTEVFAAFNSFFGAEAPGPELRMRFAAMAAEVARRFADDDAVIGYELFNEPVTGDSELARFHEAVASAIRVADPRKLVFFEPTATRNLLDRAEVSTAPFPVGGAVYAPHIYTLSFTGTEAQRRAFTLTSLRPSHANAAREAQGWQTPVLITEWGYDPAAIRAREYAEFQIDLQDEFGESSAYWLWKERSQGAWGLFDYEASTGTWTERAEVRRSLARVMPEAIAGWPRTWSFDRSTRRFTLMYTGDAAVMGPTRLYVPSAEDYTASLRVTCDGVPMSTTRDAANGTIDVPCAGPGEHTIIVSPSE